MNAASELIKGHTRLMRQMTLGLCLLLVCGGLCRGFKLEPVDLKATVRFDAQNSVRVQDLTEGNFRLHLERDGKPFHTDLELGKIGENVGQIVALRYADKDRLWIVQQEYSNGQKALLLNLAQGRIERTHSGDDLFFSRDGRHVIYNYGSSYHAVVIVDGLMLYPRLEPLDPQGKGDQDEGKNRTRIGMMLENNPQHVFAEPPLQTAEDQIEFIISPLRYRMENGDYKLNPPSLTRYQVGGLMNSSDTLQLTIRKSRVDLPRLHALPTTSTRGTDIDDYGLTPEELGRLRDYETSVTVSHLNMPAPRFQAQPVVIEPGPREQTALSLERIPREQELEPEETTITRNLELVDMLGGESAGVAIAGERVVAAAGRRLTVFNAADWSHPRETGHLLLPGAIGEITAEGSRAAAWAAGHGLQLISIDPTGVPRLSGVCPLPDAPQTMAFSGQYLVVTGGYGLALIDIREMSHPVAYEVVTEPWVACGLAVGGGLAYVTDDYYGLRIVDLRDPARPQRLGQCLLPGEHAYEVALLGHFACVALGEDGVAIVDVANPQAPQVRRVVKFPEGGLFSRVAAGAGQLYLPRGDRLDTIKVADDGTTGPLQALPPNDDDDNYSAWTGVAAAGSRVAVSGNRGLILAETAGTTGTETRIAARVAALGPVTRIETDGRLAVSGSEGDPDLDHPTLRKFDLRVLDLANPARPGPRGYLRVPPLCNMAVNGPRALTTHYDGVRLIGLADPDHPGIIGQFYDQQKEYVPQGSAALQGNLAAATYIAAPRNDRSLLILDVSKLEDPKTLFTTVSLSREEYDAKVTLNGGMAYLLLGSHLRIYDLGNPAAIRLRGATDLNYWPPLIGQIARAGNTLFVPDQETGVHCVDVSDPDRPKLRPVFDEEKTKGFKQVKVDGTWACLAVGKGGLCLMDLKDNGNWQIGGTFNIVKNRKESLVEGAALKMPYIYVAVGDEGLAVLRLKIQ